MPWDTDEHGVLHSAVLGGLGLYVEEGDGTWLRVRDAQGQRLPSPEEWAAEEAARAAQEAARAAQETAARQAAERRVAEAEAEIARLARAARPALGA